MLLCTELLRDTFLWPFNLFFLVHFVEVSHDFAIGSKEEGEPKDLQCLEQSCIMSNILHGQICENRRFHPRMAILLILFFKVDVKPSLEKAKKQLKGLQCHLGREILRPQRL